MPSIQRIPSILKADSHHSSNLTNPTFKSTDKRVIEEKKVSTQNKIEDKDMQKHMIAALDDLDDKIMRKGEQQKEMDDLNDFFSKKLTMKEIDAYLNQN